MRGDKEIQALLEEIDLFLEEEDLDTDEDFEDDNVENDDASEENSHGLTPMQKLMAITEKYQYNFRIMHWKSYGKHFDSVHNVMAEYYDELTEKLDDIAEMCMMQGVLPISLEDAASYSDKAITVSVEDDFDKENAYEVSVQMLNHLVEVIDLARKGATKDISADLDTFQYWARKEATYKCKRRLMSD